MLAKWIAIVVVVLAVFGPGTFLFRTAWRRGGTPRKLAAATLVAMGLLVAWLLLPGAPGSTVEQRISDFAGAWGILFMLVGGVTIAAAAFGRFGPAERRDSEQ